MESVTIRMKGSMDLGKREWSLLARENCQRSEPEMFAPCMNCGIGRGANRSRARDAWSPPAIVSELSIRRVEQVTQLSKLNADLRHCACGLLVALLKEFG
jgi:hypothetical protein